MKLNRVVIVEALKPVDYAFIGAEGELFDAAAETERLVNADMIVLGPDWGEEVAARWQQTFPAKQILIAPRQSTESTSKIIIRITE